MISHESEYYIAEPFMSIHPGSINMFAKKHYIREPNHFKRGNLLNLQNNANSAKLSNQSVKKARKAVKYLLYNSSIKKVYNSKFQGTYSFKIAFITLTLSAKQILSDADCNSKLLNHFLTVIRRRYDVNQYVWRAEYQKNGNIHYHILIDVYIPHKELRQIWNNIQAKFHYIDDFQKVHGHRNPNSTDIHSIKNIKNVAAYVTKYITKNEHDIKNNGELTNSVNDSHTRYWGCSVNLSNLIGGQHELDSELLAEIEQLQNEQGSKRIDDKYFSVVVFDSSMLTANEYPKLFKLLNDYVSSVFTPPKVHTIYD